MQRGFTAAEWWSVVNKGEGERDTVNGHSECAIQHIKQ